MLVIEYLLVAVAGILLLPVLVLFVQVVAAWFPIRRVSTKSVVSRPRVSVLIPAHNEAAVIEATLRTLLLQLQPDDQVLVVADNCSDETAVLAHAAGAGVIVRTNMAQRGKGYALDYGVRHLEATSPEAPEVLVIVDADCQVGEGAIDRLAKMSALAGRPVQALNLMKAPAGAGLKLRIAEFAWIVKNQMRPLGFHRLGWPCQLMGTGMAFPWAMAVTMPLANANIVEDMKMGIELALAGTPPMFCPEALVSSEFPVADAAVKSQRTRWEHGHLSMILREVPRLLGRALIRLDMQALGLALDLLVPPLALLVLMQFGMLILAGLAAMFGAGFMPLLFATFGVALLFAVVLLAWLGWGRQVVSLGDLLSVPVYVLVKIPLYFRFWTHRQREWIRTDRK